MGIMILLILFFLLIVFSVVLFIITIIIKAIKLKALFIITFVVQICFLFAAAYSFRCWGGCSIENFVNVFIGWIPLACLFYISAIPSLIVISFRNSKKQD